jgi:hypothetical protein
VKSYTEVGFSNPGHAFVKWVDKDGKEIQTGSDIPVKNGDKFDIYAVWSENEIAVAVYATDGTKNVRVNAALKDKLGLNYVQKDGYYPIGVVMIPESLVLGKHSPYLNSQADFDALKPYLTKIDTSKLTGGKNSGNTVASNLNYVQLDYGKGGNQSFTAFFDWNMAEYGSKYGEGGVFDDGRTANGVSINNPQGGNFKYHIDLRFDTHVVSYKGSYYTNNAFVETKNLTEIAYFAGTSVTKEMAQAVAAEYVNGYTVEGLYTDANLTKKFEGISSLTANSTIYVKYTKVTNFTITYKDGYTGGGDGKVLYTTQAPYGSSTPTIQNPTREYYVFNGWKPQVASTVTGDATYVATWKQQFEPGSVELKALSKTKPYDATSLAADVEFTKKPNDFDKYFVVSNVVYTGQTSITDSGTANYKIDSLKIVEKSTNVDYTSYFDPKITKNGTLTVTPIELTIGTGSDSKPFGQVARSYEITVNGVKQTLDSDNKANYKPIQGKNETLKIWTTSSKRFPLPATEDNEYKVSYENGAKKQNYKLTSNLGILSITTAEVAFVLKADDQTWTYDGTAKSYDSFTVVTKPEGYEDYTIEALMTADSKITEVGTADNEIDADTIVIKDAEGNDVTANFDKSKIVLQKGTLTVTAREIIVTSFNRTKTYDGMPLQEWGLGVRVGEMAENQTLDDLLVPSNFASITDVGTKENTYTVEETELAKNYDITYEYGELEVTPRKVTLVASSASKFFDGKPLVKRNYYIKNVEGDDGFAVYTKDDKTINEKEGITVYVKGSQVVKGTSDNVIEFIVYDGKIAKPGNYEITTEKGTLEVKTLAPDKRIKLYISVDLDKSGENVKEVLYNGTEQYVNVDVIVSADGTTEEITEGTEESGAVEEDITTPGVATEEGILPTSRVDESLLEKVLSIGAIKAYAAEDSITKEVTYNGVKYVISGIKLDGGYGIDADYYPVTIDLSDTAITLAGESVTEEFEVIIKQPNIEEMELGSDVIGMLIINPREVTLTAASATKVADGTPLTAPTYTVSGRDGFAVFEADYGDGEKETIDEAEFIKVTVEGSQTAVGSSTNKITSVEFDEEMIKSRNYIVTPVDGILTVTQSGGGGGTTGGGGNPGSVLGARRGVEATTPEEGQVLGAARKSPKTSDANNAILWAMVMGGSAFGMAAMMAQKKRKEEQS